MPLTKRSHHRCWREIPHAVCIMFARSTPLPSCPRSCRSTNDLHYDALPQRPSLRSGLISGAGGGRVPGGSSSTGEPNSRHSRNATATTEVRLIGS